MSGYVLSATAWAVWMLLAGLAAFVAFAWDKHRARQGRRRVPEARLLTLCALGGAFGAKLAQGRLRHKTRKQPFARWLNLWMAVHLALPLAAFALVWTR